ncbi:hypothetical protein KI387_029820, partial [Taxus chinensis]
VVGARLSFIRAPNPGLQHLVLEYEYPPNQEKEEKHAAQVAKLKIVVREMHIPRERKGGSILPMPESEELKELRDHT